MNTLRLKITISFWLILGLLAGAVPLVWAGATGEMEYRFERMVLPSDPSWYPYMPKQLAIAPDGSIWVIFGTLIQHLKADGMFIAQFHIQYSNTSSLNNITVAADGSVWVLGDRIEHYNADGTFIAHFESGNYSDVSIAADGSLWVTDIGNNRIQHFNTDGSLIVQFGSPGNNIGQFNVPRSITVAPDGSIWVVDEYNHRFQHFNADGTFIAQFGSEGNGIEQFRYPTGIAVAADGSVWVTDENYRLRHLTSNGTFIAKFGSEGSFSFSDIAIAPDGSIWVLDDETIKHLNADGSFITKFNCNFKNFITQFEWSYGIGITISDFALATDGSLWLALKDLYNDSHVQLQHLSADGRMITQLKSLSGGSRQFNLIGQTPIGVAVDGNLWAAATALEGSIPYLLHFNVDGSIITNAGPLAVPRKIAVAENGSVWVSEGYSNRFYKFYRVQHFKADGSLIAQFGDADLHGIAIAKDGSLWGIGPEEHPLLQHYQADGSLIEQFGIQEDRVGQFYAPEDITIAADGSLWISIDNRIQHFSSDGGFISSFGSKGSDPGQFNGSTKIALAKDHNLWITDGGNLQKFVPRPKGNTAHPYKAIVLAGGGEKIDNRVNDFWAGTWQLAQKANKALHFQGFRPHEETLCLTAGNTQFDLDNNSQLDDLQAATKDSLRLAITDWAKDSTDVVLYLAGPASAGQFQLNATEAFSAAELSTWLAELEKSLPSNGKVTVVIDAPDTGSFVTALANPSRPRFVIASTQADQPALMEDHGVNSFSYTFWSRVMDGAPLADAFVAGQQAIEPFIVNGQVLQPTGDANGNGQADAQDAAAVGNYCLGMCNKTVPQLPAINLPRQPSLTFKAASSLDFNVNVRIAANTTLLETWALVQRPAPLGTDSANPLNIEKIPLSCDAMQRCTGHYQSFDAPGQYRVHFYALDSQYQLNAPAILDIAIQPENTSTLTAEYDSRQGLLTLRDVEVSDQHYQATLQYQDGLYYLLTLGLTSNVLSPSARFDPATNLLDVPLTRVNGQDYQGSFRLVDNYLFQLLSTSPK